MAPRPDQHTLLDELDERQNAVMAQLETLNLQVERLLRECLANLAVPLAAAASLSSHSLESVEPAAHGPTGATLRPAA